MAKENKHLTDISRFISHHVTFFIVYFKVLLGLLEYFVSLQRSFIGTGNMIHLALSFITTLPIPSVIILLNHKRRFVKNHLILVIPYLVVAFFQILTLNFMSLHHHTAYGLIPVSIIAGKILSKYRKIFFILLIISVLNLWMMVGKILIMPSYSQIINDIKNMHGKILAENPNIIHLIRGTDLNDEYVYNFFYFDYNNDGKSTEEDYKDAMSESYFDYIIIPSDLTWSFAIKDKESIIKEYYCTSSSFYGFQNRAIIFTRC